MPDLPITQPLGVVNARRRKCRTAPPLRFGRGRGKMGPRPLRRMVPRYTMPTKGARSLTSGTQRPLITMHAVTLRKGQAHLLPDTSWQICRGQHWVILGPNGSGKSTLARAVRGDVVHVRGTITRHVPEAGPERIGYLSFELQEALCQRAERLAESLFFGGRSGPALTVAQLLGCRRPAETRHPVAFQRRDPKSPRYPGAVERPANSDSRRTVRRP